MGVDTWTASNMADQFLDCYDDKVGQKLFDEDWRPYKHILMQKYLFENLPIKDISEYMRSRFGILRSGPQYQRILKRWGFEKNLPVETVREIARLAMVQGLPLNRIEAKIGCIAYGRRKVHLATNKQLKLSEIWQIRKCAAQILALYGAENIWPRHHRPEIIVKPALSDTLRPELLYETPGYGLQARLDNLLQHEKSTNGQEQDGDHTCPTSHTRGCLYCTAILYFGAGKQCLDHCPSFLSTQRLSFPAKSTAVLHKPTTEHVCETLQRHEAFLISRDPQGIHRMLSIVPMLDTSTATQVVALQVLHLCRVGAIDSWTPYQAQCFFRLPIIQDTIRTFGDGPILDSILPQILRTACRTLDIGLLRLASALPFNISNLLNAPVAESKNCLAIALDREFANDKDPLRPRDGQHMFIQALIELGADCRVCACIMTRQLTLNFANIGEQVSRRDIHRPDQQCCHLCPLALAIENDAEPGIVSMLINAGAEVCGTCNIHRIAEQVENTEDLQALLQACPDLVMARSHKGHTLRQSGWADLSHLTQTVLEVAMCSSNHVGSEMLLRKGAPILRTSITNAQRRGEALALCSAASQGHVEIVQTLLDAGYNPAGCCRDHEQDAFGVSSTQPSGIDQAVYPFSSIVDFDHAKFHAWRCLPSHDQMIRLNALCTPIQAAIAAKSEACVRKLIAAGATLQRSCRCGTAPLVLAVRTGSLSMIQLLVFSGADLNEYDTATDSDSLCLTASAEAALRGRPDMLRLLIKKCSDLAVMAPKQGLDTLQAAIISGNPECIQLARMCESRYQLQTNKQTPVMDAFGASLLAGNVGLFKYLSINYGRPRSASVTTAAVLSRNLHLLRRWRVPFDVTTRDCIRAAIRHPSGITYLSEYGLERNTATMDTVLDALLEQSNGSRTERELTTVLLKEVLQISDEARHIWRPRHIARICTLINRARCETPEDFVTVREAFYTLLRRTHMANIIDDVEHLNSLLDVRLQWGDQHSDIAIDEILRMTATTCDLSQNHHEEPTCAAILCSYVANLQAVFEVLLTRVSQSPVGSQNIATRTSLLHWAALHGPSSANFEKLVEMHPDVDTVRSAQIRGLQSRSPKLSLPDDWAASPLAFASALNDWHKVQVLLRHKANVNQPAPSTRYGRTALQAACTEGSLDIAKLLIINNADINAPAGPDHGATALQAAAMAGFGGICQILVEQGADIAAPASPKGGFTAIDGAARFGRVDIAYFLLRNYGNAGALDDVKRSARKHAIEGGKQDVLLMLRRFPELDDYSGLQW